MHSFNALKKQGGATLVISLIILAIVTLMGVSSMQSSNTELKVAASMRDRGVAFEAAEAALLIVEEELATNPPRTEALYSTCSGAGCYNATCDGGLCFDGSYLSGDTEYECQVADGADTTQRVEYWSDSTLNVWGNGAKHQTVSVDSITTPVKYIVEFLCFVAKDADTVFDETEQDNGAPLYRITALAQGNGNRASVALQSTYKVLNGY